MPSLLGDVRRFNRTVTEHIGVLSDHFLGRGLTPTEARLLWEIGPTGSELRSLRARLGLDSGHLTRLVRALMDAGLITVVPSPADRRSRLARLHQEGSRRARPARRAVRRVRARPARAAERGAAGRARRRHARSTLLATAAVAIREVDPEHPDARRCLAAYYAELDVRSGTHFDPTTGSTAQPAEVRPPHGVFLVAYLRGAAMGCGALKHHDGHVSDLGHMGARGRGGASKGCVGRRLLEELERRAVEHGDTAVRLETNAVLTEAIGLYLDAGFVEVEPFDDEPFADHWFSKTL